MSSRPRILYITPCWPHAPSSGSQLRTLHIARALQEFGRVELSILDLFPVDEEAKRKTMEEFHVDSLVTMDHSKATHWKKLRQALDPRRMNLHFSIVNQSEREQLPDKLKDFDLVWLHHLYVSYMFRCWHWPNSVMDIDDLPSSYERTLWQNSLDFRRRLRGGWKMVQWRRRERLLHERFTVISVCSEADRNHLGSEAPVHVIPNGFERPLEDPIRKPSRAPRIGFIGLMDYPPNFEGIHWFVRECWPKIKREITDARLRLAGKWIDDSLIPQGADIDALGWVADSSAEIETWSVMIVPVHLGAGTRLKVAEAFSRKCPLVATRVGAFGYDVVDGRELRLADTAEDFASACIRSIREPTEASAMAERAWTRFLDKWTWDAIAPRVWAAAEDCLRLGDRSIPLQERAATKNGLKIKQMASN